ncbi:E3 ubiquitin-protein ligase Mdm2 [Anabrus simplex]|uniref:E3 ubiquitin-protein ligase Mdm2 n=1 Tax=Anabrus simplex TaxID=316456 RepID=UPI0034DD1A11
MIVQPGEDVDQQFWGDNELDSTSQSDMELSKCNSELWREKIPDIPHCSYSKRKKEFSGPPARKRRRVKHRWQPSSSLYSKAILRCHNKPGNNRIQTSFNERLIRFRKMPHPASLTNTYSSSTESDTTVINPLSKVTFKLPTEKRSRGNYTSQSSTDDDNGLVKGVESSPGDDCPSCKQRPKDAIIVHGGIGHQCYCYECTMKLWRSHANCPMCHQRIRKVVRNIPF